jgi:anti-anti-sigma regulatory factor
MFLATISKPRQLLYLSYIGRVSVEELEEGLNEIAKLLQDLSSGFRVLGDLSGLETFGPNCATQIGKAMELCDQKGVGLVVRVIPDPGKDIGLNILTVFHYRSRPRIVTCKNLVEAGGILRLGRAASWAVWRQDDSGNRFLVEANLTEEQAKRLVADFESKGHKQTYWCSDEPLDS